MMHHLEKLGSLRWIVLYAGIAFSLVACSREPDCASVEATQRAISTVEGTADPL